MGMKIQAQAATSFDSRGTPDTVGTSWRVHPMTLALLWASTLSTGCTPDQAGGFGRAMFYGMIGTLILIPFIFVREYRRGSKMSATERGVPSGSATRAARKSDQDDAD